MHTKAQRVVSEVGVAAGAMSSGSTDDDPYPCPVSPLGLSLTGPSRLNNNAPRLIHDRGSAADRRQPSPLAQALDKTLREASADSGMSGHLHHSMHELVKVSAYQQPLRPFKLFKQYEIR